MKFNYWPVSAATDTKGKLVKRPILELGLFTVDGNIINALGLVDSGADTTTMNIQYAKALGIELDENMYRPIIGIGNGKVKALISEIEFVIRHTEYKMKIPVWFVESENVDILIGQEGFFDAFKVKFDKANSSFELTETKK